MIFLDSKVVFEDMATNHMPEICQVDCQKLICQIRMPEDMIRPRMPEDCASNKSINVMVGITRSKATFPYSTFHIGEALLKIR